MIETNRLNLVLTSAEHSNGLFKIWSDPDVVQYTYNILKHNVLECETWIVEILGTLEKEKSIGPFTVFHNGNIIGFAGAPTIDYDKGEYGFFYQLGKEYWNNGYGYEVAVGLMNYIFKKSNVKRVYADAVTINKASIHILEKLDMKQIGITVDGFKKEDVILDLYNYRIDKIEYIKNK